MPEELADPSRLDAGIYLGGQDRVALIAHFVGSPPRLRDPLDDLRLRSVHQWPLRRHATGPGPCASDEHLNQWPEFLSLGETAPHAVHV
ncbi:hypothetical protein AB0K74_46750 [Streptomyces sp. NPDC056159]|uniref:hypothetical protein n=1 Tax=unclassified Streptomyces TaxID=2593676 RepID=UPI003421C2A3